MEPEDDRSTNEDMEDDEDGERQALPDCVIRRLDRLQELEQERANHMEAYMKERAALEAKYNAMNAKLYDERAHIVTGKKKWKEILMPMNQRECLNSGSTV